MNSHYHWIIWAATDRVGDNFQGITYVDVIAGDGKEAVAKARKLCPERRHYWINNVVEHHEHEDKEAE